MVNRAPITVVVSRFEDIVNRGPRALITEDEHLELVAGDVAHDQLAATLGSYRPQVAIVNFGSLIAASEVRDLHPACPQTRLVLPANPPTAPASRQMLASVA